MRFEYCIACCLTLVHLASAGPILQRSRNPDLSPLTKAANAVSSLPPEKAAAISAAARQERGMLFDISDVVEQRIAAYNEACVVIHDQSLSTTICSTADTPPSASPTSPSIDSPATAEHSSKDKSTRTETVVVTRQPPQTAPPQPAPPSPPGTNPPRPNDTPKPPAVMSLAAMSSKIVPVLPGTQDPDMPRAMTSTSKTATETIRASKVQNSPANTSPLSPFPFSFPWSLPLSWLPIPDIDLDINSIIAPILSTILPQATEVLARPTGTTTTIHLTKTFVKTMTMPPPETAPAPAPAPPETNPKSLQQPPPQKVNEGQMMTTTVYVTACNPAYSAAPVLGENDPSARPPPPPAQAAPTEVPSKKLAPPPSLDNPEPPKTTPPPDAPSGGDGRGGGGRGGGHDGGHGGGGRGGGGQGNGKGHDDDDKNGDGEGEGRDKGRGRGGASFRPITIKDNSRGDGGGLIGVITRAADDLLFN
ncbi:hypothetical protein GX50_05794 [[Emmonsia] crescens]|uniref:Uncharacterized protein n=1 Tax=[Emmonsia] crescens TaxID=73230 RepID=A0A2B7ZDL4_9EURO|nr:hypothetical protein GX50_05794 [Emmonsia crescens]